MFPKKFALISGAILFLAGVLALVPALCGTREGLLPLNNEVSYGLFLGLFPLNVVNKVALILIGLVGLAASRAPFTSLPTSINFARGLCFISAALAILGLFDATNTLYGYWPLYGDNVWASAIFAVAGGIYGFALNAKQHSTEMHKRVLRESHVH